MTEKDIVMNTKRLLLYTACLTLGAYAASAEDNASGPRFVPRPDISDSNYTEKNSQEDLADAVKYKNYEQREPCQNYRKMPRDFIGNCNSAEIEYIEEEIQQAAAEPTPEPSREKIVRSYTVLFDFDKSFVRQNEAMTLDQAMREIDKYDPQKVTVTGYTDSSGAKDYNQNLSMEREQAVSKGLLTRGIANQTIDREARGEYEQAVDTADGVKNQQNRRVVIDFIN